MRFSALNMMMKHGDYVIKMTNWSRFTPSPPSWEHWFYCQFSICPNCGIEIPRPFPFSVSV